ncbi:MAG: hypothetical protein L0211_15910 [Planctomycetaceae bacterium]|nr:hypothetical protein [Planctomycetaceae bacterium]
MSSVTTTKPDWYRILSHWKNKRGTGLSFSFLVGATRKPVGTRFANEEEAMAHAKELYVQLTTDRPEGCQAWVQDCGGVQGRIVTCGSSEGRSMIPFDQLWTEYGSAIVEGNYSLTKGIFHPMVDCEIEWVQEALKR